MTSMQLYFQIASLPENLKGEVLEFINTLQKKKNNKGQKKERKFGHSKGFFIVKPGFDDPLEDFKEYV